MPNNVHDDKLAAQLSHPQSCQDLWDLNGFRCFTVPSICLEAAREQLRFADQPRKLSRAGFDLLIHTTQSHDATWKMTQTRKNTEVSEYVSPVANTTTIQLQTTSATQV